MKRLDPTLDLVFKLMMLREPALLRHMLEGILDRPIREVTVLNPSILGEQVRDKGIVLDVRVLLEDGSRVDLEMQIRAGPAFGSRAVYYGARDYSGQLARGEGYERLTPTTVIVWLMEPLFPSLDRLHSIFELRERHTHALFGDQLTFHVLQLSTLPASLGKGYDPRVERWARFFTARDDAEFEQLASEDPIMSLAKQTLDALSEDPEAHRLAREREDAIKLYRMELVASREDGREDGRNEGRNEGRDEGRAEILLEQLGLRFGPLTQATKARVEAATAEQLMQWARRVLTASTLDEVFAP